MRNELTGTLKLTKVAGGSGGGTVVKTIQPPAGRLWRFVSIGVFNNGDGASRNCHVRIYAGANFHRFVDTAVGNNANETLEPFDTRDFIADNTVYCGVASASTWTDRAKCVIIYIYEDIGGT